MEALTTTDTMTVELTGPHDCSELIAFLAGRGLEASLTETNDHCELEIGFAPSSEGLRTAVRKALIDWLAEHDSPLLLTEAGDDELVLRPPSD